MSINNSSESDHLKQTPLKDKPQTRQATQSRQPTLLEFKNHSLINNSNNNSLNSRRKSVSPKPRNLDFLKEFPENLDDGEALLCDPKINKISKSNGGNNNIMNKKSVMFNKNIDLTTSVNKRKNEGQELEISELRPNKKFTKIEEEKEDSKLNSQSEINQEGSKSKRMTEIQYSSQMLSKMKSYELSKSSLHKNIEHPSLYKIYNMPREKTKVFWILPNAYINAVIEDSNRKYGPGHTDEQRNIKIKSELFETQTELKWKFLVYYLKDKQKLGFLLKVEKNEEEKNNPDWKRNAVFLMSIFQTNSNYEKTIEPNKTFNEDNKDCGINISISNFDIQKDGKFILETNIKMNNGANYDSKDKTGYVGLINAGNTCYMNSFLQTLYNLPSFTRCVLKMPINENDNSSMQAALQQIFYNLKYSNKAVATGELLKSFGWESREAWVQHDVQEFKCLLLDAIEEKMSKSSELHGEIARLFGGNLVNYVKCINVKYKSLREEKFYDVQLNIKDSNNIYESLEKYTSEEILDGDNLYDSETYGKQAAKKGTKFKSLPPVLFFQLIRFEYNYGKEMNQKITAKFEYDEDIDLNRFVESDETTKKNYTYKLFSVLVHSGEGSSSGHYYAFIRPKMEHWLKFNDDVVEKAYQYQVYTSNFGGTYTDAKYNKNTKVIEENDIKNITTAYMLIYLRDDSINDLLKEVKDEEIPQRLREIDFRLQREEEEKKRKTELMKVYFTSFEILQENYKQPGIIYFREGQYDEQFKKKFILDKNNRYKRCVSKTIVVTKLLEEISEEIGMPLQEFIVYKVQWLNADDKCRVQPINKHSKSSNNNMPCNLSLKTTYLNSKIPGYYPVLLILPIIKKETHILDKIDNKKRSKSQKMIDEKEEKNLLEFVHSKSNKSSKVKQEDIEELYNNILKENYFVIFFKIFNKEDKSLSFFSYDYFDKTLPIEEIKIKIERDYTKYFSSMENLGIYRETSKFKIEDLQLILSDKIEKHFENGVIIVVVEQNDKEVEKYFSDLEGYTYVTFVSPGTGNDFLGHLKLQTPYLEVINYIKENLQDFQDVDADNILLKIKGRRNGGYQELIEYEDKTLEFMLKYDEKIYVENSVIKISDLGSKFLLKTQFYYPDNTLSKIKEISCSKDILVKDFLEEVSLGNISFSDICSNFEKEKKNIIMVVLDGKQNRIISVAKPDIPLHTFISKGYNLRLEYELNKLDNDDFYVYCAQFAKTLDFIPCPFLLKASKTSSCTEIRQKLFDILQMKKFEYEKKTITINEEYFNKLKMYLKFDINTSISKAINIENNEKEFYSYKKNETDDDKFFLEIIHVSLVSRNSTKVLKIN